MLLQYYYLGIFVIFWITNSLLTIINNLMPKASQKDLNQFFNKKVRIIIIQNSYQYNFLSIFNTLTPQN